MKKIAALVIVIVLLFGLSFDTATVSASEDHQIVIVLSSNEFFAPVMAVTSEVFSETSEITQEYEVRKVTRVFERIRTNRIRDG